MYVCEGDSTTGQALRTQLCKTKLVKAGVAFVTFEITIPWKLSCTNLKVL